MTDSERKAKHEETPEEVSREVPEDPAAEGKTEARRKEGARDDELPGDELPGDVLPDDVLSGDMTPGDMAPTDMTPEDVADLEEGFDAAEDALEAELRKALDENATLRDQLMRALADAENTRRRAHREREDAARFGISKFARDLITVADNLKRALEAAPEREGLPDAVKSLIDGVEATEKELAGVFERHGLEPVDPTGESFDPNLHQAMFEVPGTGQPAGTVVQTVALGYTLNGRLLRPAMVGVAKA
ncbi:MAG: nucleotide exchange factor GrpE [Azospirillaceae bacterium]